MAPYCAPGLVAVFDYHRQKGYADLYSLHSWCGILVFVLYFMQVSPSAPQRCDAGRPGRGHECHQGAHFPRHVPESEKGALAQLDAAFRF